MFPNVTTTRSIQSTEGWGLQEIGKGGGGAEGQIIKETETSMQIDQLPEKNCFFSSNATYARLRVHFLSLGVKTFHLVLMWLRQF